MGSEGSQAFFQERGQNFQIQKWGWDKEDFFKFRQRHFRNKFRDGDKDFSRGKNPFARYVLCARLTLLASYIKRYVSNSVPVSFLCSLRHRSWFRKNLSKNKSSPLSLNDIKNFTASFFFEKKSPPFFPKNNLIAPWFFFENLLMYTLFFL